MRTGVDRRPKLLCGSCPRFVGVDEETVVCPYCMAPLKRRGVSPVELCRTNRDAFKALAKIQGYRIATFVWTVLGSLIISKVLHSSRVDILLVTFVIAVWVLFGRYVKKRVKPRYPEIFANPVWIYGVPEDPPEKQFRPIL